MDLPLSTEPEEELGRAGVGPIALPGKGAFGVQEGGAEMERPADTPSIDELEIDVLLPPPGEGALQEVGG